MRPNPICSCQGPQRGRVRRAALLLAGLLALAMGWSGAAASTQPSPAHQAWSQQTERWINEQLIAQVSTDLPLRPEVVVGRFDSRLQLAPCAQVEPFMPNNTRLWGRTRIGLRCVQGPVAWTVFLPVQVRAWGPAWVVRQPVRHGVALTEADLEPAEIDWAAHPTPPLTRPEQWLGLAAASALQPGQVLRPGMVRAPQLFASGSTVTLLLQGAGFTLTASGTALNHGVRGQAVRVRLPNRQVVNGVVIDADTVAVRL
ncbi:MAG: flagellar basal body P-ring formation chaperone FlgA [Pseudomonadota bacterium]